MRVGFSLAYNQALFLLFPLLFMCVFPGCRRTTQELPVMPPATHPLARQYIGYGVVNVSFTHLLHEPGPTGVSRGYIRRGTVVRIIERRQITSRGGSESWVLAEDPGAPSQGWLQETTLEIYDNESRANTASRAMNQ